MAEAAVVDGYNAVPRSTNELIADLGSWSPCVQRRAIVQLVTRTIDNAIVNQLTTLAGDPDDSLRAAASPCRFPTAAMPTARAA